MAGHKSEDDVEREHNQAFGPTLGPFYHALHNEVVWIHAKWLEYRKLYAQSKKRVDLLNQTAGFLFRVIQDVLWDDVLLGICRLTDPPRQGKFENLSLLRLPTEISDAGLAAEIRELVNAANAHAEFAKQWRNKRLAHRDLLLALDDLQAEPLPPISHQQVEETLASFRAVLNCLHDRYIGGEVWFENFLAHSDADALIYHLRVAAHVEAHGLEWSLKGSIRPEDLRPPPEREP